MSGGSSTAAGTAAAASQQPYVQPGEPLNDFLRAFWQRQVDAAEQETPDYRHPPLPLARIKKVMKSDPDVKMIAADAPILFCKACEIFIAEITARAFIVADSNKRRTLSRSDIAKALSKSDQFDFLIDIVPREDLPNSGGAGAGAGAAAAGASASSSGNANASSSGSAGTGAGAGASNANSNSNASGPGQPGQGVGISPSGPATSGSTTNTNGGSSSGGMKKIMGVGGIGQAPPLPLPPLVGGPGPGVGVGAGTIQKSSLTTTGPGVGVQHHHPHSQLGGPSPDHPSAMELDRPGNGSSRDGNEVLDPLDAILGNTPGGPTHRPMS